MIFFSVFKLFVTFWKGFSHDKKKYVKSTSGHELLPFDEFDGLWFPAKNSTSTKAREKK